MLKHIAIPATLVAGILLLVGGQAVADDKADITALLDEFLANTGTAQAHDRFWADELVYTSSRGERSGKPERMAAFAAGTQPASLSETTYRGEEVNVQLYGSTAVLTFRLVAEPKSGGDISQYYNTGTFLKRDGEWRAVAWQATRIP